MHATAHLSSREMLRAHAGDNAAIKHQSKVGNKKFYFVPYGWLVKKQSRKIIS